MTTPVKFLSISLRNFMSYGNNITDINLDFNKPTLIIGKNLDASVNGEIDSNGAGKTSIINALTWALYNKTISKKINQDKLINNINKKNMEVCVTFEKNGQFFRVIRYRKHDSYGDVGVRVIQKSSLKELDNTSILDIEDDLAHSSTNLINEQIESIIDIPFEIFIRIMVYSARSEPFLSLPITSASGKDNQTDILEEITGLTELSKKGEELKESLNSDVRELTTLKKIQEEIDNNNEKLKQNLASAKEKVDQWNLSNEQQITDVENDIKKSNEIDFKEQEKYLDNVKFMNDSLQEIETAFSKITLRKSKNSASINELKEIENSISNYHKQIEKLSSLRLEESLSILDNIDKLDKQKISNNSLISSTNNEIITLSKKLDKFNVELTSLQNATCPYCHQHYANSQDAAEHIQSELDSLNVSMKSFKDKLKELTDVEANISKMIEDNKKELSTFNIGTSNVRTIYSMISDLKVAREQLNKLENKLSLVDSEALLKEISDIKQESDILNIKKSNMLKSLNDVSYKLLFKTERELNAAIRTRENNLERLKNIKESINPYINTYDELSKLISNNSNKYKEIDELDKLILHKKFLHKLLTNKNSYIRKVLLKSNIQFLNEKLKEYLESLGLPHSVRFKENLSIEIRQFSTDLDFDNLSSGQQARVSLALSFAFRDVLQKRYGRINFCILDECLDTGLSSVGVQMATKFIKSIATKDRMSMFVISHRDEVSTSFDSLLEVTLENGFSTIVQS